MEKTKIVQRDALAKRLKELSEGIGEYVKEDYSVAQAQVDLDDAAYLIMNPYNWISFNTAKPPTCKNIIVVRDYPGSIKEDCRSIDVGFFDPSKKWIGCKGKESSDECFLAWMWLPPMPPRSETPDRLSNADLLRNFINEGAREQDD